MAKVKRGKHTSFTKDERATVLWLESISDVQKVLLGRFDQCRHKFSLGYLKAKKSGDRCIAANSYAGNGIRKIVIICVSPEKRDQILKMISDRFS